MNNNNVIWIVVVVVLFVVILGVGGFAYASVNRDLTDAQNRIEELQTELSASKQQLDARNKEITDLKVGSSEAQREIERRSAQIQDLRRDVDTVGLCLKGVIEVINAASEENVGQLAVSVGALKEPCKKSETILNNLKSNVAGNQLY
ncbi:MAG TPA: hypothetical protein VF754_03265 [Pyrinomonadaceae bacterium]